ncbi:hypothetical protein Tco_1566884, partial [Tanacetum coccineum]
PLSGGHTSDRAEGALNQHELSVLCTNLSNRVLALEFIKVAQAVKISALKSKIKKLEKKCKPSISHHRAWLKSVNRLSMKMRFGKKESVSKQGTKKSKLESTLDDSTVFNDQDADHGMEYMENEEAMDEGRQSGKTKEDKLTDDTEVVEDKGNGDKGGNVKELVSTPRPEVSTARPDIDVEKMMKKEKVKEKGVSIKDVDDSSRPERSILTLKPLLIIDPKDKEMEMERKERYRQDQASVDYIASLYDEVQAKMNASEELAARLQMEEKEMYTIEERSKVLAKFFKKRKKLLAEERAAVVRNKPPTRTQLRSQMMTYLKHIDDKKMNKKAAGMDEEEVLEELESTKVEVKQ